MQKRIATNYFLLPEDGDTVGVHLLEGGSFRRVGSIDQSYHNSHFLVAPDFISHLRPGAGGLCLYDRLGSGRPRRSMIFLSDLFKGLCQTAYGKTLFVGGSDEEVGNAAVYEVDVSKKDSKRVHSPKLKDYTKVKAKFDELLHNDKEIFAIDNIIEPLYMLVYKKDSYISFKSYHLISQSTYETVIKGVMHDSFFILLTNTSCQTGMYRNLSFYSTVSKENIHGISIIYHDECNSNNDCSDDKIVDIAIHDDRLYVMNKRSVHAIPLDKAVRARKINRDIGLHPEPGYEFRDLALVSDDLLIAVMEAKDDRDWLDRKGPWRGRLKHAAHRF